MEEPTRVLFVCLGNIVRSPLAEGLFRWHAAQRGLANRFQVDSAGTSSYHIGERPDSRMRRTAAERGLEYDGRARQIRQSDLREFDLILAMDHHNLYVLQEMSRGSDAQTEIRLMREFDPQSAGDLDVPDPFYKGQGGFDETYDIVERSVHGLLNSLTQSEN